jgi:hypothetical protein
MLTSGEAALRIYSSKDANMARCKEVQGRLTGWTRARHLMASDPIESATVNEIAEVPIRGGRTLPVLRLMEHGNASEEEFVISLPDLAHYVQRGRTEIVLT